MAAQTITVRVLNGNNGHPLPKLDVEVYFYDVGANNRLKIQTDSNGEGRFDLPSPVPSQIWIGSSLPSEDWFCACTFNGETKIILKNGVLDTIPKRPPKSKKILSSAKPGTVVFVATPYNWFLKLMAPLLRE